MNIIKYPSPKKFLHFLDEELLKQLHDKLSNMPNGVTRTDFINSAIMHLNSLSKKEASKICINYKESLK